MISTHAPAGGATVDRRSSVRRCSLISTHAPAGGATLIAQKLYGNGYISTHAPAGGATCRTGLDVQFIRHISTHAPAGGATCRLPAQRWSDRYFYSRPCGRGDLNDCDLLARRCRISTHAPAGGATHRPKPLPSFLSYISTHAPAGGATFCKNGSVMLPFSFLLTPLREGRLHLRHQARELGGFLLTPLREGRRSSRHGG